MALRGSAQVTAIGVRAASSDGVLKVAFRPSAGVGSEFEAVNSEQLYAAAIAASFLDALKAAARNRNAPIADDSNVTVAIAVPSGDDIRGSPISVALVIDLPDADRQTAGILVAEAGASCPYTRALLEAGNLLIEIT